MALKIGTRVRVVQVDTDAFRWLVGYEGTIIAVRHDADRTYCVDSWWFDPHEIEEV